MAQKPLSPTESTKRFAFRAPESMDAAIRLKAFELELTPSELVRSAVELFLATDPEVAA